MESMKVKFFSTASKFHHWLDKNHDKIAELCVGFHKKASGKKSITYPEALDEALSFGWIDGVRKTIDESSYTIRFTPRKPKSIWSVVNTRRVEELTRLGRMKAPGLDAFAQRDPKKTGIYSFERRAPKFSASFEKSFRANKSAWNFFKTQPPGYQRTLTFWVMSAKQNETRLRRLEQLISDSGKGVRQGMISGGKKT
jgi:uncharacterized protein YdeI (YjbR/CyaY-like superfamily)